MRVKPRDMVSAGGTETALWSAQAMKPRHHIGWLTDQELGLVVATVQRPSGKQDLLIVTTLGVLGWASDTFTSVIYRC